MENIYQHFRESERQFIDTVLNWKEQVETQYSPKLTAFLDPREQWITQSIIGEQGDIRVSFFGGHEDVERKRALIYPDYYIVEKEDFHLALYEVEYPKKFVTLEHRHLLGSLLSLGIKREKFGDILLVEDTIQIIVADEIASYVEMNFKEVGRSNISLKRIDDKNIQVPKIDFDEKVTTASSLRLDTVCASIYNLSRQKAKLLVQNGLVKVNFKVVEESSFEVEKGDLISIRGYGRSKVLSIEGKTKKEKWKIVVGKQK